MDELYAVVAAEQLDKDEANRIAEESRGQGVLPVKAVQAGRKGPWLLELAEVHYLLEEGSFEDAVSWNLTPDGVARLTRTFEWRERLIRPDSLEVLPAIGSPFNGSNGILRLRSERNRRRHHRESEHELPHIRLLPALRLCSGNRRQSTHRSGAV